MRSTSTSLHFGAVADHEQFAVRKLPEGLDNGAHFLIRHEPRGSQIKVVLVGAHTKGIDGDGRIDHRGLPAIDLPDPARDKAGVGNVVIHAVRGA
jgi:hypothetical protein